MSKFMLGVTINNLLGIAAYFVAFLAATWVAITAHGQADAGRSPVRGLWPWLAFLFLVLSISRGLDLENVVRESFRASAKASGSYAQRTHWQGPLAVLIIIAASLVAYVSIRSMRRHSWQPADRVAALAGGALLALTVLRAVSLHAIDRLLYTRVGPVNANRIFDIGLTLIVIISALPWSRRQLQRIVRS